MTFYEYNLYVLVAVVVVVGYLQQKHHGGSGRGRSRYDTEPGRSTIDSGELWKFKKTFFPVYIIVLGSDWIQAPYVYTLYKDEKGLPEKTVARLFTTGFLAAAISGFFVGSLADHYGRRWTSLVFCVLYSLSCLTVLSDSIRILFAGRVLGGVATTMLLTVFESWMISEFHKQQFEEVGSLKDIFGVMTMINGLVSILAGVMAQGIADFTLTRTSPFVCAISFFIAASVFISNRWTENYGESGSSEKLEGNTPERKTLLQLAEDKRLWALCLAMTFFEGSMYLWVFFKFPALEYAHEEDGRGDHMPFGIIFAALMCAMVLGSQFFVHCSCLVKSSRLLMATLTVASACFTIPILFHNEAVTFWCFCVFEICCGIYFPSIAHLKEKIIEDRVRARVYGLMRIPLNLIVVMGLVLAKEGRQDRENIFKICSVGLLSGAAILGALITDE